METCPFLIGHQFPSLFLFSVIIKSFQLPLETTQREDEEDMAITRRGRAEIEGNEEKRQKKGNGFQEEEDVKEEKENGNGSSSFSSAAFAKEYEEARVRRMRENAERMKLLGILDIQKKLKKTATDVRPEKKKKSPAPKFVTSNDPPRRSSR